MKTKLFFILLLSRLLLSGLSANAQTEECATMQNLEQQMLQDPSLKSKMELIERQTQEWLRNSPYSKLKNINTHNQNNKFSGKKNNGDRTLTSLCGYDNTYFTTIAAPAVLSQVVSPIPNCTNAGTYVTATGLVAGRVYRISTCGVNNFDTQISVYTAGGGLAVAHNDDWCGTQSEIYFNPLATGDYDILIDEFNCLNNSLCASLEVELVYTPRPVITIPVVVHVIHFGEPIGTGKNISDAQVQSQIDVLNEDLRRLNTDIITVAAAFRGVSDDPLIEFCLAAQDQFGNPTTGIDRWLGTQSAWDRPDIEFIVKPATIWDRDKYLNIWTVEFGGLYLGARGYGQFPGGAANTDGIVVLYQAFGRVGTLLPNYDLGRTATHEVGHWFNLRHLWGDESLCALDDSVSDTPIQAIPSSACQTFPVTDACSPNYPGIMFMNQMDYGYNQCRRMYTYGQAARMDATLFGSRISLQTSQGCISTVGIDETIPANYVTIFPNPSAGVFTIQMNNKFIGAELKIVNVYGEALFKKLISKNTEEINLSEFSNGIYFLIITTPSGVISKKLLAGN